MRSSRVWGLIVIGMLGVMFLSFHQRSSASVLLKTTCHSGDPERLCLGVKAVVFQKPSGGTFFNESKILETIDQTNLIWKQCHIFFQLDQFVSVNPEELHLRFQTKDLAELDEVRRAASDDHELLIVATGPWDRRGTLGKNTANAWTAMPEGPPYGIVIEAPFATFAGLIAHEFGHYLGLLHEQGDKDLMNPIIYDRSTLVSSAECQIARNTALTSWQKMLR